jgi:hypothetical protein
MNSSFTFTPTLSTQQSTSLVIPARLDRSPQHSFCLHVIFQGKRIEVNSWIVFELQLVLLHQLIFHIHTHYFYSTEPIFGNIYLFGLINTAFSLSSTQLSGKKNGGKWPNGFWVSSCFVVSTHISHSHPLLLLNRAHLLRYLPLWTVQNSILFVLASAFREKRFQVNASIVFELQLILLHQLIFHIHTHTFFSTEHIFGNIYLFGLIKTAFSLSSCQFSGKRNRGKWLNSFWVTARVAASTHLSHSHPHFSQQSTSLVISAHSD